MAVTTVTYPHKLFANKTLSGNLEISLGWKGPAPVLPVADLFVTALVPDGRSVAVFVSDVIDDLTPSVGQEDHVLSFGYVPVACFFVAEVCSVMGVVNAIVVLVVRRFLNKIALSYIKFKKLFYCSVWFCTHMMIILFVSFWARGYVTCVRYSVLMRRGCVGFLRHSVQFRRSWVWRCREPRRGAKTEVKFKLSGHKINLGIVLMNEVSNAIHVLCFSHENQSSCAKIRALSGVAKSRNDLDSLSLVYVPERCWRRRKRVLAHCRVRTGQVRGYGRLCSVVQDTPHRDHRHNQENLRKGKKV